MHLTYVQWMTRRDLCKWSQNLEAWKSQVCHSLSIKGWRIFWIDFIRFNGNLPYSSDNKFLPMRTCCWTSGLGWFKMAHNTSIIFVYLKNKKHNIQYTRILSSETWQYISVKALLSFSRWFTAPGTSLTIYGIILWFFAEMAVMIIRGKSTLIPYQPAISNHGY